MSSPTRTATARSADQLAARVTNMARHLRSTRRWMREFRAQSNSSYWRVSHRRQQAEFWLRSKRFSLNRRREEWLESFAWARQFARSLATYSLFAIVLTLSIRAVEAWLRAHEPRWRWVAALKMPPPTPR